MSETLKTAEPSEEALMETWKANGSHESQLRAAYAVDVAPLIAERDRLTRENEAMREALMAFLSAQQTNDRGEYAGWRISGRGSVNEAAEQARAALNALPENVGAGDAGVLAEVARLTKECNDLHRWLDDASKLYRDADARVKVLYEQREALKEARIPSIIEAAMLHDKNRVAKHELAEARATIAEAVEIMRPASEVSIRRDTYPDGPDRMDGTFNADPDFVRAARAFVEKHSAPANGGGE